VARYRRAAFAVGYRSLTSAVIPHSSFARKLAFVTLVDALGTGMYLTASALYLTRIVHLSIGQVGIGLTVGALVGVLGTVPLGILADRIGAGRLYIFIQLWRGACFIGYAFIGSFGAFVLVACCSGLADAAMPAVGTAVVAGAANDEERVDTLAKVRATRNAGYGIGALLAAVAITIGTRPAFLVIVATNAASYFVAAAMLMTMGAWSSSQAASRRASLDLRTHPKYLLAGGVNAVLAIHMTILTVGLPLWVADYTVAPAGVVGLLVALNTAMSVLLQARFARRASTLSGALGCWTRCGLAFGAFGAVMIGIHLTRLVWLAVCGAFAAVILLTCGELWQSAGSWKISYDLADPDRRAQDLATFQLGVAIQSVVGPFLIADAVLRGDYGWPALGAAVLLVGVLARPMIRPGGFRRARSRPQHDAAELWWRTRPARREAAHAVPGGPDEPPREEAYD